MADITSMAISGPQVQHRMAIEIAAVTEPHDPSRHTSPIPSGPPSRPVESVRWPAPPQDAVLQDTMPTPAAQPAAAPGRWSGRRTAAIAALALALTSAGALAAAAATPSGLSGPTEQRGGAGFGGPGTRQLGQGGGAQPGQGQQPGTGMPGPGRGNH